jgi:hypothetical protein
MDEIKTTDVKDKETKPYNYKGLLIFQTIVVLILALCNAALVYTYINQLPTEANSDIVNQSIMQGYNKGVTDAVTYIASQASQCNYVPLNISGQIVTLVSVDCLKQ